MQIGQRLSTAFSKHGDLSNIAEKCSSLRELGLALNWHQIKIYGVHRAAVCASHTSFPAQLMIATP